MRAAAAPFPAWTFSLQRLLWAMVAVALVLGLSQSLPRNRELTLGVAAATWTFILLGAALLMGLAEWWIRQLRTDRPAEPGEVALFGLGWIIAGGLVLTLASYAAFPTGTYAMNKEGLRHAGDLSASFNRQLLQTTLDAAWSCLVFSLLLAAMRERRWRVTLALLAMSYLPFMEEAAGDLTFRLLEPRFRTIIWCSFAPITLLPLLFYGALVPTLIIDWQRSYGPRHWLGVALLVALVTKQMYWLGWLQFFLPF